MAESQRYVLLDRDGVINHDSDDYIKSPDEWRPLDGSLEAIGALVEAGFEIVVVSNQSGIGRGLFTEATLRQIHSKMTRAVENAGGHLAGVYYCPHLPETGCACRKPAPGMLRQMERELGYPLAGTPLIGDKATDLELARRVAARPILVRTGYGAETLAKLGDPSIEVYDGLTEAADALILEANS